MAVFEFIEGWYNPRRRHSALAYLSPVNYEKEPPPRGGNRKPSAVHSTGVTPVAAGAYMVEKYRRRKAGQV